MVKQYLDVCEWEVDGEIEFDSNGFPLPTTPTAVKTASCRYENFSGSNHKEWTNVDGKTILQRGTIYLKKSEEVPVKFQRVKVTRGSEIVFEGNILNVYKGQLNTTIAV